jgi:hypothetical protein
LRTGWHAIQSHVSFDVNIACRWSS